MEIKQIKKELGAEAVFEIGEKNEAFAQYFTGQSYLKMLPGDSVVIEKEILHFHGAAPDCCFSHLAIEIPSEGASNEWICPVTDEEYSRWATV